MLDKLYRSKSINNWLIHDKEFETRSLLLFLDYSGGLNPDRLWLPQWMIGFSLLYPSTSILFIFSKFKVLVFIPNNQMIVRIIRNYILATVNSSNSFIINLKLLLMMKSLNSCEIIDQHITDKSFSDFITKISGTFVWYSSVLSSSFDSMNISESQLLTSPRL